MSVALRRSVPFLCRSRSLPDERSLLVDRVELPLSAASSPRLAEVLTRPLTLGAATDCLSADQVERLVEAQYEASVEFIYGHPWWQRLRDGGGAWALRAYLLESRHYLAAAPFRMASGITDALRPTTLVKLQAHHVVEEANHDTYFENGLAALGYPRELVRAARPSPVTVEWIHLMRTVAAYGPLAAAICSGLLEYTAGDTRSVRGWHDMLVERGLLPAEVVAAIFEHVETDLGLGHGSNWRKAIRAAGVVPAVELADWLNAVTLVAEMIVRWVETFDKGLSGDLAAALATVDPPAVDRRRIDPPTVAAAPAAATDRQAAPVYGGETNGLPVWPAEVYQSFTHGPASDRPGVRRVVALCYGFGGTVTDRSPGGAAQAAHELSTRVARGWDGGRSSTELEKLAQSWLTAIDGHELWRELARRPTEALVYGFMVENYHYVAGIGQHVGAAVSGCPDPVIRAALVKHLVEELNHGTMFLRGIERGRPQRYAGLSVAGARPLATTVSFVGTLRELGQRDWKAYVVALSFLQLSLSTRDDQVHDRHEGFYQSMLAALPGVQPLIAAMRQHDQEDTRLGHGNDTRELLTLLADRHEVGLEAISAAAIVPSLAWSFLDGIWQHYRHGDAAVVQRLGWHVRG